MRKLLLLFILIRAISLPGQNVLTLENILDSVMANNPAIKRSDAQIAQQKYLTGSVSLSNPSVEIEMLGDEGYTLYVEQEFDFPTVYTHQKSVEKSRLKLLESNRAVSLYDLKYKVAALYTEWQYAHMLVNFLREQDSIYGLLFDNSKREFEAGQIDFVQVSFINIRLQQIQLDLNLAMADYAGLEEKIRYISGIDDAVVPDSIALTTYETGAGIPGIENSPLLQYQDLQIDVSEGLYMLERQKAFPGFMGGYVNNWSNDRPLQHGFTAGIKVPVWFWQYKARTKAAALQIDIDRYNREAERLTLTSDLRESVRKYNAYATALAAYDSAGIKSITDLRLSAQRFFAAGRTSYTELLRSYNEAAELQRNYIDLVKNHNETVLRIRYLKGEL